MSRPTAAPIGRQIAAARALLGWRQKNLAHAAGVSVWAVSEVESGSARAAHFAPSVVTVLEARGIRFLTAGVEMAW